MQTDFDIFNRSFDQPKLRNFQTEYIVDLCKEIRKEFSNTKIRLKKYVVCCCLYLDFNNIYIDKFKILRIDRTSSICYWYSYKELDMKLSIRENLSIWKQKNAKQIKQIKSLLSYFHKIKIIKERLPLPIYEELNLYPDIFSDEIKELFGVIIEHCVNHKNISYKFGIDDNPKLIVKQKINTDLTNQVKRWVLNYSYQTYQEFLTQIKTL